MTYSYFPGCSMGATGLPYGMSATRIAQMLDVDLAELQDWNCCGSSAFQVVDENAALIVAGRNLALAEATGNGSMVTACSGCFEALRKADYHLSDEASPARPSMAEAGLSYNGSVQVRHMLDVFVEDVGLGKIRANVTESLGGLKVVCYYGCLLARPPAYARSERFEYPMQMDRLVETLGAVPLDWSHKTDCCGASFALSRPELVAKLTDRIVKNAESVGAEMIVVACPLCQSNLDMNRSSGVGGTIPIVYFTELMGVAFGLTPKAVGLTKHLRDPIPLLCKQRIDA